MNQNKPNYCSIPGFSNQLTIIFQLNIKTKIVQNVRGLLINIVIQPIRY